MLLVLMKIVLGLFALTVATISVLGLPLRSRPADPKLGFWNNLTRAGKISLISALATFALVLASETGSYFSNQATSEQASADKKALDDKLAVSKAQLDGATLALGRTLLDVASLRRQNSFLIQALDRSIIRKGIARVSIIGSSGTGDPVKFTEGGKVVPKSGDDIAWEFVCHGSVPNVGTSDASCSAIAFGRLMANGDQIVLDQARGRRSFFGTRSTGGELEYRNPSEDFACAGTTRRLEEARCQLELAVWREARWEFKDLETLSAPETVAISTEDACRRYEALYGETCEQAVNRLKDPR